MEKIKFLAFYLPQFHCIPENDKWWGKGFTEWTNTKKAKPQFAGHYQPRTPYKNNYYDLSNPEAMSVQFKMARESGLTGFCYYHYWFGGKLLLNKPLEMMRDMPDRIDYMFCWANETWSKTWKGKPSEILIQQNYGGREEWEQHFQYFLNFFKDEHYIKKENKPVLVIYRLNGITQANEMIKYWDKRCRDCGFNGIYVIEEMNTAQQKKVCTASDAILEFEPLYTFVYGRNYFIKIFDKIAAWTKNFKSGTNLLIYNYDLIWRLIIHRRPSKSVKQYLGAFVDWDNTARKASRGTVVTGFSPEKFEKYMTQQAKKAAQIESEYIFINAWNEWAEGCYLEPDMKYKHQVLEALKRVVENQKSNM